MFTIVNNKYNNFVIVVVILILITIIYSNIDRQK